MPDASDFTLNAITLGVTDFHRSVRFYEALGFQRKMRATGEQIAFFDGGGLSLSLFRWNELADDAGLPDHPRPQAFRGATFARLCRTDAEVDALMARALSAGGRLIKAPRQTDYGGYAGYFADPDDHTWEVVRAPGFSFAADGRVMIAD